MAVDEQLHREVALKQLLESHCDDPGSRAHFLLEAQITGGLEHPGIVPVYGLGSHADGQLYYAMRFVRGETLKEAIERFYQADQVPGRDPGERTLAMRQLLSRLVAVCNAVAYAHSRGVIHRDLKPSNILLGPYGETLVVDWGLAKVVGREPEGMAETEATLRPEPWSDSGQTLPGSAVGTPAYMSPEQAAGQLEPHRTCHRCLQPRGHPVLHPGRAYSFPGDRRCAAPEPCQTGRLREAPRGAK